MFLLFQSIVQHEISKREQLQSLRQCYIFKCEYIENGENYNQVANNHYTPTYLLQFVRKKTTHKAQQDLLKNWVFFLNITFFFNFPKSVFLFNQPYTFFPKYLLND